MRFPEDILHFIWKFRLFNGLGIFTEDGQALEVLQVGTQHHHAGPDFSNAKVKIGDTLWAGNVELHIKASDWNLHQHQEDAAYDNVILHVVYENDVQIYRSDGTLLPTFVLKGNFDEALLVNYENLVNTINDFPCQNHIAHVDAFLIDGFLTRVLIERLEEKSESIFLKLEELKGNWDETFYHFMAKNFGFKVNALPMEMLAQSLPQQIFAKHKDQPTQIEALLFGQAGFLNQSFDEDYPSLLKQEYQFLKHKYSLASLDLSLWKFLRMRPQNFPTLRLAQFAGLVVNSNHLFSKILAIKNGSDYLELFDQLPINAFWQTHYHFNNKADKVNVNIGKSSIQNILINTVALFLYAYGKYMGQHNYITRALILLENIVAEDNAIVKQYAESGVQIKSAHQSQAILQLKKQYCNQKKCLDCGVGIKILKH